jgi:AraC family transcriptional regulator of adaptative response/methylated-DNA-[protein]-cysteine methyltransferase
MKTNIVELAVSTHDGKFMARYSEKGLAELNFPKAGSTRRADRTPQRGIPTKISGWHRTTETALNKILAGSEPKKFPPLDLAGTAFQKNVWNALRKISLGKTKSYGEIARAIGKPKAVRAVGGACGANPVPVLVPCHRVLAANQKLGGFSGGLDWKRSLLKREGIKFDA